MQLLIHGPPQLPWNLLHAYMEVITYPCPNPDVDLVNSCLLQKPRIKDSRCWLSVWFTSARNTEITLMKMCGIGMEDYVVQEYMRILMPEATI